MFGKFMNKKFFHPGSYPNVKMRWIHEQRDAAKKKLEEEKQSTYQKEQESYQSRMLSAKSTEEKMKLDLNFLYDLPPGMKTDKEKEKDDDEEEVEVKFEWQKHAPRSKYVNDLGLDCQDQPFGVCVRNIRCFKCKAWGHQNTDRECPLFFSNVNSEAEGNSEGKKSLRLSDPLLLVGAMKEQHGISLKKSVIGQEIDPMADNQQFVPSDDDELGNDDLKFVESLTNKQKRRLLKRLNKLEKNEHKERKKKKKGACRKKSKKKDNYSSSDEDQKYEKKVSRKKTCDEILSYKKHAKGKKAVYSSNSENEDQSPKKMCKKTEYDSSSDEKHVRHKRIDKSFSREDEYQCKKKNSNYITENDSLNYNKHKHRNITPDYRSGHKKQRISSKGRYGNYGESSLYEHESSNASRHAFDSHDDQHDDRQSDDSTKKYQRKDSHKYEDSDGYKRSLRKLRSESYDEVDEKLHQIRKDSTKRVDN